MSAETESGAPVFCAAHMLDSWDERHPQAAFAELATTDAPARPDGWLVVAARQELTEFLRHPAVRTGRPSARQSPRPRTRRSGRWSWRG